MKAYKRKSGKRMLGLTNPLSDRPDFSTQGSDFEMYQGWAG